MTAYPPAGCLDLSTLTPEERYALESFGLAADDVFRFWSPYRDHHFEATLFRATAPDSAHLIPEAPFRSLALAVRLIFQPSEKGSFTSAVTLLRAHAPAVFQRDLAKIETHWERCLTGRGTSSTKQLSAPTIRARSSKLGFTRPRSIVIAISSPTWPRCAPSNPQRRSVFSSWYSS